MASAPLAERRVVGIEDVPIDERIRLLWERGELWWKLDPHQLTVYRRYRAWELVPLSEADNDNADIDSPGGMARIFVMDIARRWGKTYLVLLIAMENCLRNRKYRATYATAYLKDIGSIIVPLFEQIIADCPAHLAPRFTTNLKDGTHLKFRNGSVLKLVGVDENPNSLRGQYSDFFAFTEAGYVKNLGETVATRVYSQFMRRDHARMILESNAPEEVEHDFDTLFVPDARARDAYVFATIDDNTAMSEREKREFIRGIARISKDKMLRELYGKRYRSTELYLVAEFDANKAVVPLKPRRGEAGYARAFTAMDPGYRDKCGILFGYWDFRRAVLVIQRCWAKRGAGTPEIAKVIRETEHELWRTEHKALGIGDHVAIEGEVRQPGGLLWRIPPGALAWWDGRELRPNPVSRWTDVQPTLQRDLAGEHGLIFEQAPKPEGAMEADLNSLRTAFDRCGIEIRPEARELAECVSAARWNKNRTDWHRCEPGKANDHGHYDLLATLIYLWRCFDRGNDPWPPEWHDKHAAGVQQSLVAPDSDPVTHDVRAWGTAWPEARDWRQ